MTFRTSFLNSLLSRFSAACALVAIAATSPSAASADTLFNNLGLAGSGNYNGVSYDQYPAIRIATGSVPFSITELTLLMADNAGVGTVAVQVCNDGPTGTEPGASCATFSPVDPIPMWVMSSVRFSGTYAAAAGQYVWVIARATVAGSGGPGGGGGGFRWGSEAGVSSTYAFDGTSWIPLNNDNALLRVDGSSTTGNASSIPTLSAPGVLTLSLLTAAGAWWSRRRRIHPKKKTTSAS